MIIYVINGITNKPEYREIDLDKVKNRISQAKPGDLISIRLIEQQEE